MKFNINNIAKIIKQLGYVTSPILAKKAKCSGSSASSYLSSLYAQGKLKRETRVVKSNGLTKRMYFYELNEIEIKKPTTERVHECIKQHGKMSAANVAKKLELSKSAVNVAMNKLKAQHLIKTSRDSKKELYGEILHESEKIEIPPSIFRQLDAIVLDAYRTTRGLPLAEKDEKGLINVVAFQSTFSKDKIMEHLI